MSRAREEIDLLVDRFAEALKLKLVQAEAKHGWNGAWRREDWQGELVTELLRHVGKGDPLDVAAYCAFAWHHGWPVSGGAPSPVHDAALALIEAVQTKLLCRDDNLRVFPLETIERLLELIRPEPEVARG